MLKNFTALSMAAMLLSYGIVSAQSVGINTDKPGSTLDVNGSLAAKYTAVTSATFAMTSADFHISYKGTTNATFTLPAAVSGVGNFKGRMYTIKNNTAFTITVNPAASETINGSTSVTVAPSQSLQLISTGLTGAASTWEISGNNSSSGVTASNGLTAVGSDVRLGGTLSQNTVIDYGNKALILTSNVNDSGFTRISNINPGANATTLLQFTNNDVPTSYLNMFLNSSTRTADGGANAATINNSNGPLTLAGNNSISQFRLSLANGAEYFYNATKRLQIDGNGSINTYGPGSNFLKAVGTLSLQGNDALAQFNVGFNGLQYYYNGGNWLNVDGSGNIAAFGTTGNSINAAAGPLYLNGNNGVAQFKLSQTGGGEYFFNGTNRLQIDGNGSITTYGTGGNAINAAGGPLYLKGNNGFAQFMVGNNGLQYYYDTDNWLNIDGYGDIYMNRQETSEFNGGNKIVATKGHLDLSGFNTLNPAQPTQIYLGTNGFRYRYNGNTPMWIDGNGTVFSAGGFVNTSDMRLKTQIKEIGYGLNTIMALQPKQYEISDNIDIKNGKPAVDPGLKTQHKIGFLAQDLYKLIPEAVHKPKDDSKEIWTVDYTVLVPALTKAIQEQQSQIEQQTIKIKKLELEMQTIKKKLGL
jgi:hypothetical protein